jgi:uncharacterized protein YdhG (YjbR/CyaY superfamily)
MGKAKPPESATVDDYIASFSPEVRERLEAYRAVIRKAAPEAKEGISYGMPAYTLNGPLVYFAAHKAHVGLYALPQAIEAFKDELSGYKTSKGTIQFPFDCDPSLDLVRKIVRFRVRENLAKSRKGRSGNA